MSVSDYMSALKMGKKEYHACVNKGRYPYLPVLESIINEDEIDSEVCLGEDQIPLRLVVGTCNKGRTNAFAANFMPLLDWGTEFSAKWASLSDAQINEGIRDSIKVYEYMNKFYVLEGNKRVSVLKYFDAVTVNAVVYRKVPKKTNKDDVKIYYEFMDFYNSTRMNDIYFSNVGSFTSLMELVGIKSGVKMDDIAKQDFSSSYLRFRAAFENRGGDHFDYPVGDAYLRFIHIFGYNTVKNMTDAEFEKNIAKSWAEFELLSDDGGAKMQMKPSSEPKKNILSFLLPKPSTAQDKLKIGFVYEGQPDSSEWSYAHELGRRYIEDTFGSGIRTNSVSNVVTGVNDEEAIEKLIKDGNNLIFVTSPTMIIASVKAAIKHPDIKILDCSLNTSHKYIRTYYARMFEAKFLTGVIAGALAGSDNIGYVAQYPVKGTMANINAFALGARFVNPRAKVHLAWSSVKNADVVNFFKVHNIKYVSDQDMITPNCSQRRFGLYKIEDNGDRVHLAMPVWHWGVFYEKLIQSILSGSWNDDDSDTRNALNYWWGISADVVDLICSNKLPKDTLKMVDFMKHSICKGMLVPFKDELIDQDGKVRNKDGNELSPEQIISMDWLIDSVIGKIPEIDDLDESIQVAVLNQEPVIDLN